MSQPEAQMHRRRAGHTVRPFSEGPGPSEPPPGPGPRVAAGRGRAQLRLNFSLVCRHHVAP
eukprot:116203-Hanusia_phi.AAC.1